MKQKNFFEFEVDDEAKGINVESLRKSKAIREQFINDFGFVPTSIIKRDVKEQMSLTKDKVLEERGGGYNQHHKGMMHKIRTSEDYVPNLEKFGMRLQGRTGCLSRFPQNIGRLMIDLYCPEDGVIYDPFCGHNSRLELCAYRCGRDYIGVDCCAEFMEANRELVERKEKINTMGVRKTGKVTLIEGSSHKVDLPDNLADFSITSPPYSGQEYYGPEKEQLGFERDYKTFLNTLYLHVKENKRILKEGAFCVWFINDFRKDGKYHAFHIDLYNLFMRAKFEPYNIYIVDLVNTVQTCFVQDIIKNKILPKQHEYILVMRKPMEEKDE
jgi:DNA modification methylase